MPISGFFSSDLLGTRWSQRKGLVKKDGERREEEDLDYKNDEIIKSFAD
jgi:hypothetical protein